MAAKRKVAKVQIPLVVIVGPTASGKSALALEVAERYNGEIICADSRTVYVGMDIGTAKPSLDDQKRIRHHLLDVVKPDQKFTAAEFKRLAEEVIKDINSRGKRPILVGGSGLYIDSVIFDYKFGPPADKAYRQELNQLSVEQLQSLCREKNIDIPVNDKNKRHLVRAIEMGKDVTKHGKKLRKNTLVVGITTTKEDLQKRISLRAKQMLESGILKETQLLGDKYGWEHESMTGNIYPIFKEVIDGTISDQAALDKFTQADRKLVKKQLTWFKRNTHIHWSDNKVSSQQRIEQFLTSK